MCTLLCMTCSTVLLWPTAIGPAGFLFLFLFFVFCFCFVFLFFWFFNFLFIYVFFFLRFAMQSYKQFYYYAFQCNSVSLLTNGGNLTTNCYTLFIFTKINHCVAWWQVVWNCYEALHHSRCVTRHESSLSSYVMDMLGIFTKFCSIFSELYA